MGPLPNETMASAVLWPHCGKSLMTAMHSLIDQLSTDKDNRFNAVQHKKLSPCKKELVWRLAWPNLSGHPPSFLARPFFQSAFDFARRLDFPCVAL